MSWLPSNLRRRLAAWDGIPIDFDLGAYRQRLPRILATEVELEALGDSRLRTLSDEFRKEVAEDGTDAVVDRSFALVREASRRVLGLRPYDVQILAALALQDGRLVEMATGEGKTLSAVPAAYLAGLEGRGVHILTFNDYLARRDAEWMGPIFRFLGLSVGWVGEGMEIAERRRAYRHDITYVTAKEAGFDLLRAHLIDDPADAVHREFHAAIVDEADSILIDEARVPLVIAGSVDSPANLPHALGGLVRRLSAGVDFRTDEYERNVELTPGGIDRVEEILGCGNLTAPENLELLTGINCALHAAVLLRRDVDYIVQDGRIQLIDEFTGRVVEDRHWPDGLQTALEAKEELRLRPEGRILSSITLQSFIRLYPRLAGMTATARPAAHELESSYGTRVVVIPPHRPSIRIDHADRVFTHKAAKHRALVDEIVRVHELGRPILVGTCSVAESEELGDLLRREAVEVEVLNARDDAREAEIIAQAGRPGAVTISTNMAGRGTDIRLGGADERQRQRVVDLGGLYVIGTNRHESLRIDQQLRGRAGRQGDPGSSRFFVSLEDDLIVRYGVRNLIPEKLMPPPRREAIDSPAVRREIARAQRVVEGQGLEIRKTLEGYSALLEEQRRIVFRQRSELLGSVDGGGLAELAPDRWAELSSTVGEEVMRRAAREIALFHLDRAWSEHLARVADLREGIHLLGITGNDPHAEFLRGTADSFSEMERERREAAVRTFESAQISGAGLDLEREGLRGPSATWTYLINDDPFRDRLAGALAGNVGFAAAAALPHVAPLLILWGLYNRYLRRRSVEGREPRSTTPVDDRDG